MPPELQRSRELYAAAWQDFCRSFWDEDRREAANHMRVIRQRLEREHGTDIGDHYLSTLPGWTNWTNLLAKHPRRFFIP